MEFVAKATKSSGGMTIGIVPSKVEERGHLSDNVDVHIPCDNLNDRKALMMAQSDVFIALPGGIGTLDEIFTVAASATIGYHSKTLILYDINGFWDTLIGMLDDLDSKGMVRGEWKRVIKVANTLDDIKGIINGREVSK